MLPSLLSTATSSGVPPRLPPSLTLYRAEPPSHPHAPAAAHGIAFKKENIRSENLPAAASTSTAVVATTAQSSRAKSNSERGKEFRAKRKKYEGELETDVYKLRAHIAELDMRKSVWEKQFLDARHTESGSLVHLVREYFSLFRFGLRDPEIQPSAVTGAKRALMPSTGPEDSSLEKIRRQEEFIAHVMDADALVGEKSGPSASLAQWRMYTISHDSLRNEPYCITSTGTVDHPCVEVLTNIHGRISRDTIKYVFPGALHDDALVQKFLHRDVVYKSTFRFHFTDDNRIAIETADINIVEGLQDAGFALDDISRLMQTTVLTPQCMIPEPVETEPRTPSPPPSRPVRQVSPTSTKLSLNFLLGSEEDELRPDERVQEIIP